MTDTIRPVEWAPHFDTGLESIDEQHHRLVDLVNLLGNRVSSGSGLGTQTFNRVLDGLSRYASFHFASEEALMREAGVDERHLVPHLAAHAEFVAEMERMRAAAARDSKKASPLLLRYVSSWLSFHILDADQAMARQIRAIRSGVHPAAAFEQQAAPVEPANAALLGSLRILRDVVAQRSVELAAINDALEAKLRERTSELREAERRLQESEKLTAIARLATGVAGEISQPLACVSSNLGDIHEQAGRLLAATGPGAREDTTPDGGLATIREALPGLLDETVKELDRVSDIVATMREMADLETVPEEPGRLENVLRAAVSASACGRAPGLVVNCTWDTLPPVRLSRPRLRHAFQALLDNAAQAVSERGSIRILAGWTREEVWVDVIDNGCGMSAELQSHIFEPFFTTRAAGSGRGLGLTLARQVVLGHGGRIEVESTVGEGSRFRVVLPRILSDGKTAAPARTQDRTKRPDDRASELADGVA